MKKIINTLILILFAPIVLGLSGAAMASDSTYQADNLTIQVGTDVSELNFTWLTTDATTPKLVIWKKNDRPTAKFHHGNRFHQGRQGMGQPPAPEEELFPRTALYYTVHLEEVVEEESSGGPGGGPPTMSSSSTTDSTGTETSDTDEDVTVYCCKVTVLGLDKNTTYAYALGYDDTYTDTDYIRTQNPEHFNFIFVGDPQIGASRDADSDAEGWADTVTAALTKFEDTAFIFSAGDQVESSSSDTQYDGFFSAAELTSIPFAPATGNHDTNLLYSYHFNVPNESDLGGLEADTADEEGIPYAGDYWFRYGKVLFMVLNTNNDSATSHSEFMDEAIEINSDALWRVVVFHHSLYSSARHVNDVSDLRTSMVPVMDEHDIDVVLAGHDHFYARTYPLYNGDVAEEATKDEQGRVINPQGTVYFTANSASGSKYYDFTEYEDYTYLYLAAYAQPQSPSYLNIEVGKAKRGFTLTVSAYLSEDGEELDSYTILKKIAGDLNYDGVVDCSDVRILQRLVRCPASINPDADLDNDGWITEQDLQSLAETADCSLHMGAGKKNQHRW